MALRPYTTRTTFTGRERDLNDVEGLDEAIRKLRALPAAITGRNGGQVRSALMYATLPIFKGIKANLMAHPADIGELANDVRRLRVKSLADMAFPAVVGQGRGEMVGQEAVNIGLRERGLPKWWWFEWGTKPRHAYSYGGGYRGVIMAQPFFRPGFDMGKPMLAPRFALKLKQLADREVRKLAQGRMPR